MIIKETLVETVQCAIPFDHSTHNEEYIFLQIRSHPELEDKFHEQLKKRAQWVKDVEKVGKLYLIFNKTIKYKHNKMALQKASIKLSYVGKNRIPTISINC